MTEALVVRASNVAQHPQLAAGKQAVRNRDPQHWCEALNVETVTQTQRAKLVVRNLAGEKQLSLIAILCDAFVDKLLIVGRSEERRVGKECVSTCSSRWTTDH